MFVEPKQSNMETYKGYEVFRDAAYFDMVCIRKFGSKVFSETIHVNTFDEARQTIDELTALFDYIDWYKNKYGGVVMISEYWINQFINGK